MVSLICRSLVALALLGLTTASSLAQSFQIADTQVDIAVAPGYPHADYGVPISGTAGGFNFSTLSASSDASWVTPVIDPAKGEVRLSFQVAGLTGTANTATVTVSDSGTTDTFLVKASVTTLNLIKLVDDPVRSRIYGIHQNGANTGCIVAHDPIANQPVTSLSVGKKPTDLVVSKNGAELLAINYLDHTISVIDLATFRLKETISLAANGSWTRTDTTATVAFGPGATIYYTDAGWVPTLWVYDRNTQQILQSLLDESGFGFGDLALTPDEKTLFSWATHNGTVYVIPVRYSVDPQGRVTFQERLNYTGTALQKDPVDAPVLVGANQDTVFIKDVAFKAAGGNGAYYARFPKPIYSVAPGGEFVATDKTIYETATGDTLFTLPVTAAAQVITNDYARLVYFNRTARTVETVNLPEKLPATLLNQRLRPANGVVTLAPDRLEWSLVPGAEKYRVYLGTSATEVGSAVVGSPTDLGEVFGGALALSQPLQGGTTYYWRVDAFVAGSVVKGSTVSFTVSSATVDQKSIQTATITGDPVHEVAVQLGGTAGLTWTATATEPWITFAQSTGTTPATLKVIFNASSLAAGWHRTEVSVQVGSQAAFKLPVTLDVDALNLTVIESERATSKVYAVSEAPARAIGPVGTPSRAYLLELDAATQTVQRILPVGTSATDLAVHSAEGRVYVTNWLAGNLIAIDQATFEPVRTYPFEPIPQGSLAENDVHHISAGPAGRLLVEPAEEWIEISLFDTVAGLTVKKEYTREGGGEYEGSGRYYYHGDSDSSGAELWKYDTQNDVFAKVAHADINGVSAYGSRNVVVAQDGNRVFWNGGAFTSDLAVEWLIGQEIYSATPDGRYAFGQIKIYDVAAKQVLMDMPAFSKVSAYNAQARRLVLQFGQAVRFYTLDPAFPAPVLSVGPATAHTVKLNWDANLLATNVTLQMRPAGTTDWQEAGTYGPTVNTRTVPNLAPLANYEFRLRTNAQSSSSPWSAVVTATTGELPVPVLTIESFGVNFVKLVWTDASLETGFTLQRRIAGTTLWQDVATVGADVTSYTAEGLNGGTAYEFRLKADSGAVSSSWSTAATVTTGPNPAKLIYKMTGRVQQWGQGTTATKPISGFFVWEPDSHAGAQIVVLGTPKTGAYHLYEGTFEPQEMALARNGVLMVFPAVETLNADPVNQDLESSLMRGTAVNVKAGGRTFFVPRLLTGKGWATGLGESARVLMETAESYTLDLSGTIASNAAGESLDEVVTRLTNKLIERGYQPGSHSSVNPFPGDAPAQP